MNSTGMTQDIPTDEPDDERDRMLPALAVAILALDLIAHTHMPDSIKRTTAQRALKMLAEKYGYTRENT